MTALSLLVRFGPWVIIGILVILLQSARGDLDHVKMQAKVDVGAAELGAAKAETANTKTTLAAVSTYADRTAALQPLVVRSTDTVTRYAETPAGRASCLAADRVSGLDALDRELFPAAAPAAGGSVATVPANASAPPAGRVSEQR
jgi:hypothetical protein